MSQDSERLLPFMFVSHTLVHALVASLPLFVPVWLQEFGATRASLGFVLGLLFVFYGGMAIPSGVLSDRYGSPVFVTLFLLTTGLAALLLGGVGGYPMLVGALVFLGLGAGLYHAPAFSLLSRRSESRSRTFAYHNVGAHLGLGLGPMVAAVLLTVLDWRSVFLVAAAPFLLFAVVFYAYGPSSDTGTDAATDGAGRQDLWSEFKSLCTFGFLFILAVYLLRGTYYRGSIVFLPDFLQLTAEFSPLALAGRSIPPGQWLYALILLVGVFGQLGGGFLGERVRSTVVLTGQLVATAVLLFVLGDAGGWALFALAIVLGLLLFSFPPILQDLVASHTPTATRGLGYGVTTAGNAAAGGFLGASLAGWLATTGTYASMFRSLALVPLLALGVVAVYVRWFDGRSDASIC